jgi:hypothetical protein
MDKSKNLWHDRANLETGEFKQEERTMSELENKVEKVADAELGEVVGGVSANYLAAVDVMNGKYGNGEERKRRLAAAGYDYWAVQHLVNGLANGYDAVARDVIAGKYGNDQYRVNALRSAGYDPAMVQDIVNAMLK